MENVKANGNNLEFVPKKSRDYEVIITALSFNEWVVKFTDEQNEEYCLASVP